MKLFVWNKNTARKTYLRLTATERDDLRHYFSGDWFHFPGEEGYYHVSEVFAEADGYVVPSSLIGGVVGVLAGPFGVLLGLGFGGLAGKHTYQKEKTKENYFNQSL